MFESVPRSPMAYFSPALSFSVGPGKTKSVEIDDVSVSASYSSDGKPQWMTLFHEDFRQLKEKNSLVDSGWRTKGKQVLESDQKESGVKTLSIQPVKGEEVTVVKSFNIPIDFPFDVSDKTFEIRYNDDMLSDSVAYYDAYPRHGGYGASGNDFYASASTTLSNSTPGISRTAELFNTYYIYTFDGKLLAEYDHNGSCIRDYIYFGNRLIAEYKPQTGEYFYYMTDQINSTRIITNGNGDVVFSEAYGPYGDIQKTWTNTYDPKLKFSGKEREGYSDLGYFGARYYDRKSYRFNSVDPIINRLEALYNPQLWNLYAYCRNNPITYLDTDGSEEESKSIWDKLNDIVSKVAPDNMTTPPMMMEGWEENKKFVDKAVEDAIKITAAAAVAVAVIEMASGDNSNNKKQIKPSIPGKMQKEVEKGKAPKEVDHVDSGHVPGQEPHVHLKDGTSLTQTGKVHDKHKGIPNPTKQTKKWLKKHGW